MATEIVSGLELAVTTVNIVLSFGLLLFVLVMGRVFTTGTFGHFFSILRISFILLFGSAVVVRLGVTRRIPLPPSPYSLAALDDLIASLFIIAQFYAFLRLYLQWKKLELEIPLRGKGA